MMGVPGLGVLSAYTLVLSLLAPAILRRATWVLRAPRLAIVLWQALCAAWLVSLGLLGLTLAGPLLEHLAWPNGDPLTRADVIDASLGVVLAASVLIRAGYVIARELRWARRERRSHANALALAGEPADQLDATVLEHATPAVYCLPNRDQRRAVVVSSGARQLLSARELAAVIAHERGHLRLHHHHVIAVAEALQIAFPLVPLLKWARQEIEILAEMAADDQARRDHSPEVLAGALLTLARARTPEYALGAAGHTVTSRLERMLSPRRPLAPPTRLAPAATAACAITLPIGLACSTVFAAASVMVDRLFA